MACYANNVVIIAAVALNGVIGRNGQMPWRLPSDLRRFKELTMGKTIAMGRRTYESLPSSKLPGRDIIVLSRSGGMNKPKLRYASSLEEAMIMPRQSPELIVAGGAVVYEAALKYARRMIITRIRARPDGDTFFPPFGEEWCWENTPTSLLCDPRDEYETAVELWVSPV